MVNLNNLAKDITINEGLKKSVSISQVKEIMKLIFKALKQMTLSDIIGILNRYK